ncbi:MAG TPA: hypothetical protein VLT36_22265, partial [Candidatus Dormibacteraeota bacterium]|nr:hypothetical protein [Candidatus Dormibacteraeota bacterium]
VDFSGSHDHFIASFNSADDLMRRTPAFWQQHVVPKLDHDFCGVWKYLNQPFPHGTNAYMQRVQSNMDQLKSLTL